MRRPCGHAGEAPAQRARRGCARSAFGWRIAGTLANRPEAVEEACSQHEHEGGGQKLEPGDGDGARGSASAGNSQEPAALKKTASAAMAPVVSAVPSAMAKVAAMPAAKTALRQGEDRGR